MLLALHKEFQVSILHHLQHFNLLKLRV